MISTVKEGGEPSTVNQHNQLQQTQSDEGITLAPFEQTSVPAVNTTAEETLTSHTQSLSALDKGKEDVPIPQGEHHQFQQQRYFWE